MSGLESRSSAETIALVDQWTGFSPPAGAPRLARTWPSSSTLHAMPSDPTPGPEHRCSIEHHIVGGEVAYWLCGVLFKFDGARGRASRVVAMGGGTAAAAAGRRGAWRRHAALGALAILCCSRPCADRLEDVLVE